jgi:hypothetical protein
LTTESTKAVGGFLPFEVIVKNIRKVGVGSTVLGTDFGQARNIHPVAAMKDYLQRLAEAGFKDSENRDHGGQNAHGFARGLIESFPFSGTSLTGLPSHRVSPFFFYLKPAESPGPPAAAPSRAHFRMEGNIPSYASYLPGGAFSPGPI